MRLTSCFSPDWFLRRGGLAKRSSPSALAGLLSPEQFARVLARERARSDRTGEVFSPGRVYAAAREDRRGDVLPHLARILGQRLRSTDDAGLLDRRRIGVDLAGHAGLRRVDRRGRRLHVHSRRAFPCPNATVYCYPTDWPIAEMRRRGRS